MTEPKKDDSRRAEMDHDVLIRIDTNLLAFMKRFEEHEKKDDRRFNVLEKALYCFVGAATVVGVLIKLWR